MATISYGSTHGTFTRPLASVRQGLVAIVSLLHLWQRRADERLWLNQMDDAMLKDIGLGLLVTMGNPKPILFYSALLPTFLDMTRIHLGDFLVLAAIVVVISYLVYGGYILLAERSREAVELGAVVRDLEADPSQHAQMISK